MEIVRNGTQPSMKGPPDWFTGNVRVDCMFQRNEPSRVGGGIVTFEPGARTAWHLHPLGQTLIILSGVGINARADRLTRSERAMSFGVRPTQSTGTVQHRRPGWRM